MIEARKSFCGWCRDCCLWCGRQSLLLPKGWNRAADWFGERAR